MNENDTISGLTTYYGVLDQTIALVQNQARLFVPFIKSRYNP